MVNPSCLRVQLWAPSHPIMYFALIVSVDPDLLRLVRSKSSSSSLARFSRKRPPAFWAVIASSSYLTLTLIGYESWYSDTEESSSRTSGRTPLSTSISDCSLSKSRKNLSIRPWCSVTSWYLDTPGVLLGRRSVLRIRPDSSGFWVWHIRRSATAILFVTNPVDQFDSVAFPSAMISQHQSQKPYNGLHSFIILWAKPKLSKISKVRDCRPSACPWKILVPRLSMIRTLIPQRVAHVAAINLCSPSAEEYSVAWTDISIPSRTGSYNKQVTRGNLIWSHPKAFWYDLWVLMNDEKPIDVCSEEDSHTNVVWFYEYDAGNTRLKAFKWDNLFIYSFWSFYGYSLQRGHCSSRKSQRRVYYHSVFLCIILLLI